MGEPRDPNPVPDHETGAPLSGGVDGPHDLVARDTSLVLRGQIALGEVQIGAADATGLHFHPDLVGDRLGRGSVYQV